ncbi:DUF4062 domain-containing protein [Blastococcus brunescens]|uniref:DUF4062 domain-containing protein n=1 Tax=Blastococcus brunescens TaxID=1564165 RepID=A0ABZ1AXK1_9ACTN|nr:DUF4062 domain-containing protein [Blastococcus sp. BMG 8361]WRL63294.1 DUF4062 domain-containing protein [Blastococcus sp. BMG 8361]
MAGDLREPDVPGTIATPDRRLRVFVSSTLEELAPERAAVRAAVTRLHLTPVMFDLGARAHPPRPLYRAYLDQSDVFVGIYGERYGWIAPDMGISGLEDEYDLSAGRPRLLYVRRGAPGREPRLDALITRMQADSGASTTPYEDADDLAERVADDLAVLLTERFAAPGHLPAGARCRMAAHPGDRPGGPAGGAGARHRAAPGSRGTAGDRERPGGIGKSRLATAAAQELAPERDAVWLVDLEAVGDPADVPGRSRPRSVSRRRVAGRSWRWSPTAWPDAGCCCCSTTWSGCWRARAS